MAVAGAVCISASAAVEVANKDGVVRVSDSGWTMGDKHIALVRPVIYMSDVSVNPRLMVATDDVAKLQCKAEPTIVFSMADGSTLKFVAQQSPDLVLWDLSLNMCIPSTFKGDFMNTPLNQITTMNMNHLAEVDINQIRINNLVIPVKEPTAFKFKEMFDAGLSKTGRGDYYAAYNPRPVKASSGKLLADGGLPRKGELSAATFAAHPFGFVSDGSVTREAVAAELKSAKWPVSDGKLLVVENNGRFRNPFKMHGRPVSLMSAYFHDGDKMSNYKLTVSEYAKSWKEDMAREFAEKVVADLEADGFTFAPGAVHGARFFAKTGRKGSKRVEVVATKTAAMNLVTIEVM